MKKNHFNFGPLEYSSIGWCAAWYVFGRAVLFRVHNQWRIGNMQKAHQ